MYYAAMGAGLVCHTLNPRLTAAHLAAMVNEAQDRVLAVSASLVPLLAELTPLCPGLEHVILMDVSAEPAVDVRGAAATSSGDGFHPNERVGPPGAKLT